MNRADIAMLLGAWFALFVFALCLAEFIGLCLFEQEEDE